MTRVLFGFGTAAAAATMDAAADPANGGAHTNTAVLITETSLQSTAECTHDCVESLSGSSPTSSRKHPPHTSAPQLPSSHPLPNFLDVVVVERGVVKGPVVDLGNAVQVEVLTDPMRMYRLHGVHMAYESVYLLFPLLWEFAGRNYKHLDLAASVLFLLGSVGFAAVPLAHRYGNYEQGSVEQAALDASLIAAEVIFVVAMLLLQLRALYGLMWKRFHLRPGAAYLSGVGLLAVGCLAYLVVLILDLKGGDHVASGYLNFLSGLLFFGGSAAFAIDGLRNFVIELLFMHIPNHYFWGSLVYTLSSALFVIAGVCTTHAGRDFDGPDGGSYRADSVCSDHLVNWLDGGGGIGFVLGSVLLLMFSVHEFQAMEAGPDPRTVAYYGLEEPHPAHHEPHHLRCNNSYGEPRINVV
eukprot:m.55128 g.55128  ORF g.55128 m.55128 type:complete len:411 (+) comp13288_c0_seq3:175-1407(+)